MTDSGQLGGFGSWTVMAALAEVVASEDDGKNNADAAKYNKKKAVLLLLNANFMQFW